MSEMRPGWYRVRIEGCASWQCAEVVDSSRDPSADPRFVEWAGRDWPITDIAEWGERITMPDDEDGEALRRAVDHARMALSDAQIICGEAGRPRHADKMRSALARLDNVCDSGLLDAFGGKAGR